MEPDRHLPRTRATSSGRSALARSASGLLSVERVKKSFGPTRALIDASLTLQPGSIVGMVGENGSGKSTLVKILSGVLRADGGTITLAGRDITALSSPSASFAHGIATVFQEVLISRSSSVLENLFLGYDSLWRSRLTRSESRRRAAQVLEELSASAIDLDTPAEHLSLSQQQTVVTARALIRQPQFLILDEATSALDVRERDQLFENCARLRTEGCAILFISHRMEELFALADQIVVIRDGETLQAMERAAADHSSILSLMTGGRRTAEAPVPEGAEQATTPDAEPGNTAVERPTVLTVRGLSQSDSAAIDFELSSGTIVGLAGLEGHGQERFLEALAGLGRSRATAGIFVRADDGSDVPIVTRFDAWRHGIVYLPRNRGSQGTFPPLSILDNFGLPTLRKDERLGIISRRSLLRRFEVARASMHIRLASPDMPITSLSGGNQQKVLLGRWLAADPRVLLLDDPTRGVDLPTKRELHEILRAAARGGVCVVALSTELEELEALCGLVLVFHEGAVEAQLAGSDITRDAIAAAMFGVA